MKSDSQRRIVALSRTEGGAGMAVMVTEKETRGRSLIRGGNNIVLACGYEMCAAVWYAVDEKRGKRENLRRKARGGWQLPKSDTYGEGTGTLFVLVSAGASSFSSLNL